MTRYSRKYRGEGVRPGRSNACGPVESSDPFREAWAFMVRHRLILALILGLCTGIFPGILFYIIVGVVNRNRPDLLPSGRPSDEFSARYRSSRAEMLDALADSMDRLDARLRRMEDVVTRPGFDWDSRMRF